MVEQFLKLPSFEECVEDSAFDEPCLLILLHQNTLWYQSKKQINNKFTVSRICKALQSQNV